MGKATSLNRLLSGLSTRTESIRIHIRLNAAEFAPVAQLVKELCGWAPKPECDDDVLFHYDFNIDYLGDVEKHLTKVLTILTQAETATVSVESELLDGASCLFARVIEKLRQIQTALAQREA